MHFDFSAVRIAVVGDLILDCYIDGSVGRLSPEAPVPVLLRGGERNVLGGAANVAANIVALGGKVEVVGLVGADAQGSQLLGLLGEHGAVGIKGVVIDDARPTTCKTRITSGRHQLVRIDAESKTPTDGDAEERLLRAIQDAIAWADVVVLSDYAKGVCSDRVVRAVIDGAARSEKPSIVDPKRNDFTIYRGATLIKPNMRELSEATRLATETNAQAEAAARAVIAQTGSAILLTRSEQGMSFFSPSGQALHLRTAARDVFDVSGAGDTVVAIAALGYAAGLPTAEIMRFANLAAGIVVGKVGTAVVSARELDDAVSEEARHFSFERGHLVTTEEAIQQCEQWRRLGLRVGFTNGCFDLLHPGHISLLRQAAEACDRLVVAINTDASVRRLKGPSRPVQDERSRAFVLGALSMVDLVVLFGDETPRAVIEALKPDVLVKGADYTEEQVVGASFVRANGGRVLLATIVPDQSTTSIIRRSAGG